jgi:exopolysaccharide production protein ExoQ
MREITGVAQEAVTGSDQRMSHLVVGWMLMIPLFYFASQGDLWFNSQSPVVAASYANALTSAGSRGEDHAIILSVFTIALVLIGSRIKSVLVLCSRGKEFVVLAGLALGSCLWSQLPRISLLASLYFAINIMFAFYLYQRFNHRQVLQLLLTIGWICLVSSILLALLFPKYGISQVPTPGAWRGIYDHKNLCAEMTIFLLAAAFFAPAVGLLSRLFRIAYILLSVIVIFKTHSLTGWLLLAFLLAYVVVMRVVARFPKKDSVVLFLLLIVGGVLPLVIIAISYFKEIMYLLGKDPTLTGRTRIWSAVVVSAMKRPLLGYGYRAFWTGLQGESGNVLMANGWSFAQGHNGFLEVWVGLGAVGVAVVLYSLLKSFRNALPCISARNFYLNWCVCIVLLIAVHAMDEQTLAAPNNLGWILYIVASIGLADGARRIRFRENHA